MKKLILSEFKNYLTDVKKVSASSAEAYCRDAKSFSLFLESEDSDLLCATKTQVIAFMVNMQKCGKADASVSRAVSSLRTLYAYLMQNSLTKSDPTFDIKLPRLEKKSPTILMPGEIDALLDVPDMTTPRSIRDKAMLEVMYASGIKVSELISLKLSDADTELGYLRCCHTKNIRIVPLGKSAIEALKSYLLSSRPLLAKDGEDILFVSCLGLPMSRQGFWKIIKEYAKKAGIKKDITPRTLRSSFALHLIENGADLASVQEMMGHKDISSTQSYAKLAHSRIREVYNKAHPRA